MFQPSDMGAQASTVPSATCPHREQVRHLLIGSVLGIDRTIKELHSKGYADPNDWSGPLPTGRPDEWMAILTKRLIIE